jgi:hypothetical protein
MNRETRESPSVWGALAQDSTGLRIAARRLEAHLISRQPAVKWGSQGPRLSRVRISAPLAPTEP